MKVIDEVLAVFEDGEWHGLIEVGRQVKLDDFKVGVVFEFLAEYGFIEVDEKGLNGKLAPQYQTFLKQLKSLQVLERRQQNWAH